MKFHNTSKPNQEIRAVCRLRSLAISRRMTILLLLIATSLLGYPALYAAVTLLCFPHILNYAITAVHPQCDQAYLSGASLPETLKANHFRYSRYRAEKICFYIILILLILWQTTLTPVLWHGIPIWRIPAVLLLFYLIISQILYFYLKYKLHYNFSHLIMDR